MMLKFLGVIFVVVGCGAVGFSAAMLQVREEKELKAFLHALEHLRSELEYRLTPLPMLSLSTSAATGGNVGKVFRDFSEELESQCSADVSICMSQAIARNCRLCEKTKELFHYLGDSFGHYDLSGQVREIEAIRTKCCKALDERQYGKEDRLRSYKTLGLCAGAALAILLV